MKTCTCERTDGWHLFTCATIQQPCAYISTNIDNTVLYRPWEQHGYQK